MDFKALRHIGYGMYIISSHIEEKHNGQIANTVFQITSDPVLIGISINKRNLTHEYITSSKQFSISVININADFKFIGKFGFRSGREIDKFKDIHYKTTPSGVPVVLEKISSWIECNVIDSVDCGTHTLFLGEASNSETLDDTKPMTYDYYHNVIKGKSPKTAPTYISDM